MTRILDPKDKYYIDNPGRVKDDTSRNAQTGH